MVNISCPYYIHRWNLNRIVSVFTVFRLLTDFVCLYNYEFWLSLCKIVRSSVILLLPLFSANVIGYFGYQYTSKPVESNILTVTIQSWCYMDLLFVMFCFFIALVICVFAFCLSVSLLFAYLCLCFLLICVFAFCLSVSLLFALVWDILWCICYSTYEYLLLTIVYCSRICLQSGVETLWMVGMWP